MILDWKKFIVRERPRWERLEEILATIEKDPWRKLSLAELRELEMLYQRAAADLARLSSLAAEPVLRRHLEQLVARAYTEVHGGQGRRLPWKPWTWLTTTLPQTFRRQLGAFYFACLLTLAGALFGGLALSFDARAKEVLMPFSHLQVSPSDRVAREESAQKDRLEGHKATFSGQLMVHNTQVALSSMALGIGWGLGTIVLLFYNGVLLGAIAVDYIQDGQLVFLLGWLLPHGVVEIPAILVSSQGGLVLARAVLGRDARLSLSARLRAVVADVVTLGATAMLMLVWAGIIEAFFSQYHEPALPYWLKISFGCAEAVALAWFLSRAGRPPAASFGKQKDTP